MNGRTVPVVAMLVAIVAGACSSNPAQPSIAAPQPVQPATGTQISFTSQPVTLVISNAVVSQTGAATYDFEVAIDPAFGSKVATKSGIAAGSGGQTSVALDALPAGTYYWHARAEQGGTTGIFGSIFSFTIGPHITISAPTPVSPANGASSEGWPALTVINAPRSGPIVSLVYKFEISTSATFSSILLTGTVSETLNQTTFTPPAGQLPPAQQLFWRATAIDQIDGISGTASAAQSFTPFNTPQSVLASQEGLVLWSGVQPPGSPGHATLGNNWDVQVLAGFDGARFLSPPLEALQVYDLLDRGLDPDSAISWMNSNGYSTIAAYYPSVQVIGFSEEYMALILGQWDLVLKAGA